MHRVEKDLTVGRVIFEEQLDLGPRENEKKRTVHLEKMRTTKFFLKNDASFIRSVGELKMVCRAL
jgi:hypothetical protein